MGQDLDAPLEVSVELGGPLRAVAEGALGSSIAARLTDEIDASIGRLGLVGASAVAVRGAASERTMRVRVRGEPRPYPPDLMRRAWWAVAPVELLDQPEGQEPAPIPRRPGFPDAWFADYVAGLGPRPRAADWAVVTDYLARLVRDVIEERPGCLVGAAQAAAYLREAAQPAAEDGPVVVPAALGDALRRLLDLGVSVADRASVLSLVGPGREFAWSPADGAEAAFARLRSSQIELHAHPDDLAALGVRMPARPGRPPLSVYAEEVDAAFRELFRAVMSGLAKERGIPLPPPVWVASPRLRSGMVAVKINDRLGPPLRGPRPGELLVAAPIAAVRRIGIDGRPADPFGGLGYCVVPNHAQETVERAGLTYVPPRQFVLLALAVEIRRLADRLLSSDDVDYLLAQLDPFFPDLVHAVLGLLSLDDLTRVLRGLVEEGVSIGNLPAILDRLLRYDTIPDAPGCEILDNRLPLRRTTPFDRAVAWPDYLAFVRIGLRYQIGHSASRGTGELYVYRLDPAVEELLVGAGSGAPTAGDGASLSEDDRARILDALWAELANVPSDTLAPAIMTSVAARRVLRDVIAGELPWVPVLCPQEIPAEVRVEDIARISLGA